MPKPPLLYPERKRCCICRKHFGYIVLYRRYCSYECAQLDPPDPRVFPRCCFLSTRQGSAFVPKKTFFTIEEALASWGAQRDPTLQAYWCGHCHMVHLGHDEAARQLKYRLQQEAVMRKEEEEARQNAEVETALDRWAQELYGYEAPHRRKRNKEKGLGRRKLAQIQLRIIDETPPHLR